MTAADRTPDDIRADVIVSHFLGTEIMPTIPDALRMSEQIADAFRVVRRDAEKRAAARALEPFRELFAGGPDTACRTSYPDGIEWVEVPMADLRRAFEESA